MKRDFSTVLRNLRGEIIRVEDPTRPRPEGEEPPPATLAFVATEALMQHVRGDENMSGEQKLRLYRLAGKVVHGGVVEVTAEEIALLKERIGKGYGPNIVGPAYELLDTDWQPPAAA